MKFCKTNPWIVVGLLFAMLSSVAVNFHGRRWGEPFLLHCDEAATVGLTLAVNVLEGESDAPEYTHPHRVSYAVLKWLLRAKMAEVEGLRQRYEFVLARRFELNQLARIPYACAGVLLTLAIGILAWLLFGPLSAMLAAICGAFSPLLVSNAHMARPDIGVALFATATCCCAVWYGRQGRVVAMLLGVVLCALAILEKYPGTASIGPLGLAWFSRHWFNQRRTLAVVGSVATLLFVALTAIAIAPDLISNWDRVVAGFDRERGLVFKPGYDDYNLRFGTAVFYAQRFFELMGPTLLVGLLVGTLRWLCVGFRRPAAFLQNPKTLIYCYVWGAFFVLALQAVHVEKWMTLYFPCALVLAIGTTVQLMREVRAMWIRRILGALLGLALVSTVVRGAWTSFLFGQKDTRVATYEHFILDGRIATHEDVWGNEFDFDAIDFQAADWTAERQRLWRTLIGGNVTPAKGTEGWGADRYSAINPSCAKSKDWHEVSDSSSAEFLVRARPTDRFVMFSSAASDIVDDRFPVRSAFYQKITSGWRRLPAVQSCPFQRLVEHENYRFVDSLLADFAILRLPQMLKLVTSECNVGPVLETFARPDTVQPD